MDRQLVLVDRNDTVVGVDDKISVHRSGRLHRAFSVFVFDDAGRLLLQQRARDKYHSGGLWSNTCCSHPGPQETVVRAAQRRLEEEMGFSCRLRHLFGFIYRADLDDGFIEHEYDHVLAGVFNGEPAPDPGEVGAWKWSTPQAVMQDLRQQPGRYTYWFKLAFERLMKQPPPEMSVRESVGS